MWIIPINGSLWNYVDAIEIYQMHDRGENWQSVMNAVSNMRQESKIAALRNILKKIFKNKLTKQQKMKNHIQMWYLKIILKIILSLLFHRFSA